MQNAAPPLPPHEVDEWLHLSSPRVRFLKSLPWGASVLDLGAGDGTMVLFKEWLQPKRPDLKMFALSLSKGVHFDRYDGFEIGNFETQTVFQGVKFDAVFSAHFVEHISGGPARVLAWIAERLRPDGQIYIEMPSEESKTAPTAESLRAMGHPVLATNFYDDHTHIDTVSLADLRSVAEEQGFFVEESGYWRNRLLEPVLLERSRQTGDAFYAHAHFWMKTRFAQYIIAQR